MVETSNGAPTTVFSLSVRQKGSIQAGKGPESPLQMISGSSASQSSADVA